MDCIRIEVRYLPFDVDKQVAPQGTVLSKASYKMKTVHPTPHIQCEHKYK